jgi:uncharacterized membrane protein YfcA
MFSLPFEIYLLMIPLGFVIGVCGTLIGAGGGFLLAPILLLLFPSENATIITSISMAVVFFNALSGSIAYGRMGRIDFKSGIIFAAATIPGAIIGSITTNFIPRGVFDILLGALMIVASVIIFLTAPGRPEKEPTQSLNRFSVRLVQRDGTIHQYSYNVFLGGGFSVIVGFISSLLGIGGGILHVPFLSRVLKFPVHVATATSHFVLVIMALTATIVNIASGAFYHGFWRMVFLSVGVFAGAQLGAVLSKRIRGMWIIRGLALALVVVGIRLVLQG